MTAITIPDGVLKIGDDAFFGCSSLSEIEIPESVKIIDSTAFNSCVSLKNAVFHRGLREIGFMAFASCALESVILPPNIVIQEHAFDDYCEIQFMDGGEK